eukprot:10431354-Heterocapsa_arctica.AAC.1
MFATVLHHQPARSSSIFHGRAASPLMLYGLSIAPCRIGIDAVRTDPRPDTGHDERQQNYTILYYILL